MESPHASGLTRRNLIRLGALSVGGVAAASATASASAPTVPASAATGAAGPGQDGSPNHRLHTAAAAGVPPVTGIVEATSYNGWVVGKTAAAIGVRSYRIKDTAIYISVRSGDVATVMTYLAARFNAEVEKLRPGQIWGYEYRADVNNTKWWSCHASGTAIDLNAVLHPNHAKGTFAAPALARLRRILTDCNGVVYWGGDYSGVTDAMHFEINVPPGDPRLPELAARIRAAEAASQTHFIALRACVNSRYVASDIFGANPLIANREVAGAAEQFEVVTMDAGYVALRARADHRFVCAERAGAAPLIANRTQVGTWERFTLMHNADGTVSLRAAVNGRYVTAESRGTQALIANRTAIGSWEKFAVTG